DAVDKVVKMSRSRDHQEQPGPWSAETHAVYEFLAKEIYKRGGFTTPETTPEQSIAGRQSPEEQPFPELAHLRAALPEAAARHPAQSGMTPREQFAASVGRPSAPVYEEHHVLDPTIRMAAAQRRADTPFPDRPTREQAQRRAQTPEETKNVLAAALKS